MFAFFQSFSPSYLIRLLLLLGLVGVVKLVLLIWHDLRGRAK